MFTEYQNTYTSIDDCFNGASGLSSGDPYLLQIPQELADQSPHALENIELSRKDLQKLGSFNSPMEFELSNLGQCGAEKKAPDADIMTREDSACSSHMAQNPKNQDSFLIFSGSETPI